MPISRQPKHEADTKSVQDLVALVREGQIRIPRFQRGLNWTEEDVRVLFDSIYRGYPIGSPLLWQGPAEARRYDLGPLIIDAPEITSALWVVDGQQRLVALTAALTRPDPYPTSTRDDPYVVYFDAAHREFRTPRHPQEISSAWVPVSRLADSADLSEWIFNWEHAGNRDLRSAVFEAGRNIREYLVPLYIVRTNDTDLLRDIFHRVNKSGRRLEWSDVHRALFVKGESHLETLDDLAQQLQNDLGLGSPDPESQLLPSLLAIRGLDVTQNLATHYRNDPTVLRGAVSEALPVIRRSLSFLRRDCAIPHLRLLPRSTELIVLARFFALHPEPKARTVSLLVRWVWRSLLDTPLFDERTLRRRAVSTITESDEEQSVQNLLGLVRPGPAQEIPFPESFDARAAGSRIVLLSLASLRPRYLTSDREIDVADLIHSHDADAFQKIVSRCDGERSPANRVIHFGRASVRQEILQHVREHGTDTPALRSHAIYPEAGGLLASGDVDAFLQKRRDDLKQVMINLGYCLAGWGRSDRPSIDYILQQGEDE